MEAASVRVADGVAWEVVEGEAVVLHVASGRWYTLNATATVVFSTLAAGGGPADAVAALCRAFDVDPARARADVDHLVAGMAERGLLTGVGPA